MPAVIAGQRHWVSDAFALDSRFGMYVNNLDAVRLLPKDTWVFFVHWSDRVPEDVLQNYRCVGFHMTDLPFGRGGSPLQNCIRRGMQKTVLTAYRMTSELDSGPIYLREFDIPIDVGAAQDIYSHISIIAIDMAYRIWQQNIQPEPQDGTIINFARLKPEDSLISGYESIQQLYDHIRMLDAEGYPSAFLRYGKLRVNFSEARDVAGALLLTRAVVSCES